MAVSPAMSPVATILHPRVGTGTSGREECGNIAPPHGWVVASSSSGLSRNIAPPQEWVVAVSSPSGENPERNIAPPTGWVVAVSSRTEHRTTSRVGCGRISNEAARRNYPPPSGGYGYFGPDHGSGHRTTSRGGCGRLMIHTQGMGQNIAPPQEWVVAGLIQIGARRNYPPGKPGYGYFTPRLVATILYH